MAGGSAKWCGEGRYFDWAHRWTQMENLINENPCLGGMNRGFTHDAAGRRTTMTVAGQSTVAYTYDNANRRTSLTLPNGIAAAYTYDAATRVTGITYTQGATTIGDLAYTYDANGQGARWAGAWGQ